MKRRAFIAVLCGASLASPRWTHAQQAKLPTIGFLGTAASAGWLPWTATFVQRLGELGWIEGRTVAIDYRWAEGRSERYDELAAEFVRLKVDVIVTAGNAVRAAMQATSAIPIVFAIGADPVAAGLVTSLSRPGGNVTGLSVQRSELAGKRLEILREALPAMHRLAILANVGFADSVREMNEIELAARSVGFAVTRLGIRRAEDVATGFAAVQAADALYVCSDSLVNALQTEINSLVLSARLPTMHSVREFVEGGGLMSYGPTYPDLFRRAAEYVDKILRGAKPGDLPVQQPTKFELIINLKTAKTLGLTIPEAFLLRADQVIE